MSREPRQHAAADGPLRSGIRRLLRWLSTGATLSYVAPMAAAVAMTFRWFRPGEFVAGGDVSPFLRGGLAQELWSGWTHQLTGAGSTSYEMTRTFEVLVIRVVAALGGSPAVAQHVQYAVLVAFAAFGAAYFARALITNRLVVAAVGVLAVANPLVMVSLPLVLPLVSIGVLGVFGGMALRAAQGIRIRGVVVGLASLPVSFLAINPPNLAVVAAWVVVLFGLCVLLAGGIAAQRLAMTMLRGVPWAVAMNLWWLVPLAFWLRSGNAGTQVTAVTDAAAWSWSHVQNSLGNVATLRAHWGWGTREMLPFSRSLGGPVWEGLRWIVPGLAVVGVVVAPRSIRRLAVGLCLLGVMLVFLGKGFHRPFTQVNAWMYLHVPLFWLLRDPVNKVGPMLLLVELLLAAVAIETVASWAGRRSARGALPLRTLILVAIAGALISPWPMWTGAVIADDRGSLPSTHVTVPDDWYRAADVVNASPATGKALVLPLGSFYQLTTTWGYHGVDNLAAMMLHRPVLQRTPGGYYGPVPGFEALLDDVEQCLRSGDLGAVPGLLRALGISHILVRKDLSSAQVVRPLLDPAVLTAALAHIPGVRRAATFGLVDVYEFDGGLFHVGAPVRVHSNDPATTAGIVANLASGVEAIADDAHVAESTPLIIDPHLASPFVVERAGAFSVQRQNLSDPAMVVSRDSTGAHVDVTDPNVVDIDSRPVLGSPPERMTVERETPIAVEADDTLRPLAPGDTLTVPGSSGSVALWSPSVGQRLGEWSALEDCYDVDARSPADVGLQVQRVAETITLAARAHAACVWAPVQGDLHDRFQLTFGYRTVSGSTARICLWQDGPNRCAAVPPLATGSQWMQYAAYVRPEPGTTALRLYLYADGPDRDGVTTATEYRRPLLVPLTRLTTANVAEGDRPVTLSAGRHVLSFGAGEPQPGTEDGLRGWSSLEDCLRLDSRNLQEAGLGIDIRDGTVRLTARAHAACTWASVDGSPTNRYHLGVTYRTLSGMPARICVWQVGPNRCAELPPLTTAHGWTTYDAYVQAEPGTTGLGLYLYADGSDQGDAATVTEYRGISMATSVPFTVTLTPQERSDAAPPTIVSTARDATSSYRLSIADARGGFLLGFADSYASGWVIDGLPRTWSARHVMVDGYSNGWIIDGQGTATLTIRYRADVVIEWARTFSIVALGAGAVTLVLPRLRLFRRRSDG